MSGFLQTLAGGVVGAGAVLAALYLPPLVAPGPAPVAAPEPAPAAGSAPEEAANAVPAADPFGPGAMILAAAPGACPAGWTAAGQVALVTSPDYPETELQPRSEPGFDAPLTTGWARVPFTLCRKEGG